jgi:DNA-binding CsgD family transcriptional regulator
MPATVKIHWTEAEDAHLLNLRAHGYTNKQIADSVRRPRTTVGHRLIKLKAQHTPEKLAELRAFHDKRPQGQAPVANLATLSPRGDAFWTDEMDERITSLRARGLSYRAIGEEIGRHESTVWDRLMLLLQRKQGAWQSNQGRLDRKTSGRADFMRRPCGPTPAKPDASPHPREPAWRRCLGDECGRVFWSQSAGVRICPRCKGAGNETVRSGTGEFCLHL